VHSLNKKSEEEWLYRQFFWRLLQKSLLSKKRKENDLKVVFEGFEFCGFFFFFQVLGFELRASTLSHSTSPFYFCDSFSR
jgi:hypothetical protein